MGNFYREGNEELSGDMLDHSSGGHYFIFTTEPRVQHCRKRFSLPLRTGMYNSGPGCKSCVNSLSKCWGLASLIWT